MKGYWHLGKKVPAPTANSPPPPQYKTPIHQIYQSHLQIPQTPWSTHQNHFSNVLNTAQTEIAANTNAQQELH